MSSKSLDHKDTGRVGDGRMAQQGARVLSPSPHRLSMQPFAESRERQENPIACLSRNVAKPNRLRRRDPCADI
jgi:hypothetical protein